MLRNWPSFVLLPVLAACSSAPATGGAGGAGGQGGEAQSSAGSSQGGANGASSAQASSGSGAMASSSGSGAAASSSSSSGGMGSVCAHPFPEYTANNGSVTYYTFSMGSPAVNCGFAVTGQNPDAVAHVATGAGKYFGAMNTADYNNAATCGACV